MVALGLFVAFAVSESSIELVETAKFDGSKLPFERAHGMAVVGGKWVIGGLRGLAVGSPGGEWKFASREAVRQLTTQGESVWVVYGSGAVDRLEPKTNRVFFDVLYGSAMRPWAASVDVSGDRLRFGGSGGWLEKDTRGLLEFYSPAIGSDVVTSSLELGGQIWVGGQHGLYSAPRLSPDRVQKFGFASGLPDCWITGIALENGRLVVATAMGGLARLKPDGKFERLDGPSSRIRSVSTFAGRLAIGCLDGAFVRKGANWQRLTGAEATFLLSTNGKLWIGEPNCIRLFEMKAK